MSLENEIAAIKYLLNSTGDREANDFAKAIDPDLFYSYSVRQAVASFKQSLSMGFWPETRDVFSHLDEPAMVSIQEMLDKAKQVVNPEALVDTLRSEKQTRRALEQLSQGFHALKDRKKSIDEIIQELSSLRSKTDGWEERDFVDVLSDIESGIPLGGELQKNLVVTGLETIDKAISAPPGSYGVLAAMPGVGKTSLMFQTAVLSAMSDSRVFAMSLETPKATLEAKAASTFFASQGGAAYVNSLLRKGGYTFFHNYQKLGRDRFRIAFHPAGLKFSDLEAKIRRMAEHGYNVFFVDYFSLIEPDDRGKNEHSNVAEMSKSVKALAAKLQVHICFVAQPSGEVTYDERPKPEKLATSKQVFRDYDWGLFLWFQREQAEEYRNLNGNHLKLLKAFLHKNRVFQSEDYSICSEPEVWVEAELRRNYFKEIPPPVFSETGKSQANKERERL